MDIDGPWQKNLKIFIAFIFNDLRQNRPCPLNSDRCLFRLARLPQPNGLTNSSRNHAVEILESAAAPAVVRRARMHQTVGKSQASEGGARARPTASGVGALPRLTAWYG
jgi:hypothetical protein